MLIPCPWCGLRDEREFDFGGSDVKFPDIGSPQVTSTEAWNEAVHIRENTKGDSRELWYHRSGCERWISLTRSSVTHEFTNAPTADQGEHSDETNAD